VLADGPPQLWAVVFDTGDTFPSGLTEWAEREGVGAASFTAVGAFEEATLGYYDLQEQRYADIPVHEQVEVLTLSGDVSRKPDGGVQVHAHVVCGRRDGSTVGGHVQQATVRPTLEVMVTRAPTSVRRRHDDASGLALIDLGATSREADGQSR
jgi:predicted DNA-binding protein with PD1-like motif